MGFRRGFAMLARMWRQMTKATSAGTFWRPLSAALLLIDFFSYSTGNPSIAFSLLRGWFIVEVIAFVVLSGYALSRLRKGKKERAPVVGFLLTVIAVSALLLVFSEKATEHGAARMAKEVSEFIEDPKSDVYQIDGKERALAQEVLSRGCSLIRESFIPTFKRIDYLFTCPDTQKYRLVLTKRWNGDRLVSFRMVVS
jgi:hypothetical protein